MIKNMLSYTVKPEFEVLESLLADRLEMSLSDFPAGDPGAYQWRNIGFAPVLSTLPDKLTFVGAAGATLMCVVISERQLPGSVIKDEVAKKARRIEEREDRKIYRKEYAQLKDEVVADLLPKAFIRHTLVPLLYMPLQHLLVVATSSQKRADDVLSLLRHALGRLPVEPVSFGKPYSALFNLAIDDPQCLFTPAGKLKVQNPHGKKVTMDGVDILDDDVSNIRADCDIKEMSLLYTTDTGEPVASFTLTDTGIFKQLKLSAIMSERIDAQADPEDAAAMLDSSLAIWSMTIVELHHEIRKALAPDSEADNDEDDDL